MADELNHAPLWGMGRVAASEHPEFWGGVVDLPAGPLEELPAGLLLSLLHVRPAEPVLAVTDGEVRVPRLVPAELAEDGEPFTCRADGTYLITGGLGVLGLVLAEHLAQRGARRIVLLGRTAVPPRAQWSDDDPRVAALRRLEAAGVTVTTVAADITDLGATRAALDALQLPPIRGGPRGGHRARALLHRLDAGHLRDVMRPKVDGAMVLHELFPPGSTDFFVLFSSSAPCSDCPARARTRRPTLSSTHWPPTGGRGSRGDGEHRLDQLARHGNGDGGLGHRSRTGRQGHRRIAPDQALRAFDQTVGRAPTAWLRPEPAARPHRPAARLLAELARATPPAGRGTRLGRPHRGRTGRVSARRRTPARRRRPRRPAGGVGVHRPLTEAGVDSLLATAVRVALERDLAWLCRRRCCGTTRR